MWYVFFTQDPFPLKTPRSLWQSYKVRTWVASKSRQTLRIWGSLCFCFKADLLFLPIIMVQWKMAACLKGGGPIFSLKHGYRRKGKKPIDLLKVMFYGFYHGKSPFFTTMWDNMFSVFQASFANPTDLRNICSLKSASDFRCAEFIRLKTPMLCNPLSPVRDRSRLLPKTASCCWVQTTPPQNNSWVPKMMLWTALQKVDSGLKYGPLLVSIR